MALVSGGTVYIGRDNTLDWQLIENHDPLPADRALAIHRALLVTEAVIVDSETNPERLSGLGTDTLSWRLGQVPELVPLIGRTIPVRLVVFATDYPGGLVWADRILIAIR